MDKNAKILWDYYDKYFLEFGNAKVPTPYRTNIPYQEDPRKFGKSDPDELKENVIEIAKEQNFELNQASSDAIKQFMIDNLLGVDCSGYAFHTLDNLSIKLGMGPLSNAGFPKQSRVDVKLLTSDEFSKPITSLDQIRPGDMISFQSGPGGHSHVELIMEVKDGKIIYTHSTGLGKIKGIQQNSITITSPSQGLKEQDWDEELASGEKRVEYFNPEEGDGVRRLKALL